MILVPPSVAPTDSAASRMGELLASLGPGGAACIVSYEVTIGLAEPSGRGLRIAEDHRLLPGVGRLCRVAARPARLQRVGPTFAQEA